MNTDFRRYDHKTNLIFNKDYIINHLTETLRERLPHCYGKDTVQVHKGSIIDKETGEVFINAFGVYHYGALIAVVSGTYSLIILNSYYYHYSRATGRVRNEIMRFFTGTTISPELRQLEKIEKNSAALYVNNYKIIIAPLNKERI